jgi:hypothetical protein
MSATQLSTLTLPQEGQKRKSEKEVHTESSDQA